MNADPLARIYRTLEYLAFGRALERCRFSLVNSLAASRHVLIFGEGDGRFLTRLLALNAEVKVDVVDSSARMIQLARNRIGAEDVGRVRFIYEDALTLSLPGATYDAIVTNFFLDCLTADEAGEFIMRTARVLKPDGLWAVGEFHLPDRGLSRMHASIWLATMYRFFALTTSLRARRIPPYGELLRRAGLRLETRQFWRWGMLTAEVWRL